MTLRTKTLIEIAIKDALLIWLLGWCFFPWVQRSQHDLLSELQGSVLSISGLLMAAAIVGAFELSYSRTPLGVTHMRYLAHASKFMIYCAIALLMSIAMGAMGSTPGFFNDPIAFAGILVFISLLIYDVWDVLCALREVGSKPS